MSELVAHKADVTIPVYGTIADAEVYLKEKADKVIAEKDKELRHQKFKRCLAMAKLCHEQSLWWYSKGYGFEKYDKFWEKWRKRWQELAERFKEAK